MQRDGQIFPLAKQSRLKFPISSNSSYFVFQLIHADVWGPLKVGTYDRKHYFVTLVDDFSRYIGLVCWNKKVKYLLCERFSFSDQKSVWCYDQDIENR